MRNRLIAVKYFYREYTIYNLLFTLLALITFLQAGPKGYAFVFWFKVSGYGITAVVYYLSRKKYLYFFHNLNMNRRSLFISALLIDGLITILFLLTVQQMIKWIL